MPKTTAHLVARAGGSSRRSQQAILATSLASSRERRMVHRRMSSRRRRLVLLRVSYLASSARLLRTSPQRDAMTRPVAAGRRLRRGSGCGISNLVACCRSLAGRPNDRSRSILVVAVRSGEGPFPIRFADLGHRAQEPVDIRPGKAPEGKLDVTKLTRQRERRGEPLPQL